MNENQEQQITEGGFIKRGAHQCKKTGKGRSMCINPGCQMRGKNRNISKSETCPSRPAPRPAGPWMSNHRVMRTFALN